MIIFQAMGVDMTGFNFDVYFPPEFHEKFFLNFLAIPERLLIRKNKYAPMTLQMLETALLAKSWNVVEFSK